MFYLTIVNKILRHSHSWLARQYLLIFVLSCACLKSVSFSVLVIYLCIV